MSNPTHLKRVRVLLLAVVASGLLPLGSALVEAAARLFHANAGRLPEASKMIEAMRAVDVEARVIVIDAGSWQHRVVTFVYPIDSPRVWVWDPATMSLEVQADSSDAESIVRAWFASQQLEVPILSAQFDQ